MAQENQMSPHKAQKTRAENDGGGLDLFNHLSELRSRIIKALLFIALGFMASYNFAPFLISFLIKPLREVLPAGQNLIATGLTDNFIIHLKVALWGGIFLTAPLWLYQLWAFVAPGLYRHEKRQIVYLALAAAILLLGGAAFAYFAVFPLAFTFFISYSNETVSILPAIGPYLSLVMTMLIAFGLAFQLPLLLFFLALIGLIDADFLRKFRPYAVLIIVILAALLTPPDVISQILMAVPLWLLYEISVGIIAHRGKKTQPKNP
ncbi:MAG: twin-arginine translocase subunit TatC [Candidatus Adiutrix sp.]